MLQSFHYTSSWVTFNARGVLVTTGWMLAIGMLGVCWGLCRGRFRQSECFHPEEVCTHTMVVICAFPSEAVAQTWELPHSLQCCRCGAMGGEKNLPKRGKVLRTVSFTTTSCILPLSFLQFDFIFFNWLFKAILHFTTRKGCAVSFCWSRQEVYSWWV